MYVLAAETLHLLRTSDIKSSAFIFTSVMGLGAASSLLARSLHSFYRPQQPIVGVEDGEPSVMFFPVQTSHTRLFPKVHSLSYPFMWTGIPIGFRGEIGTVLSCERRIGGLRPAWFTVDACDYMRRGNDYLGLDGKLHEFLISQVRSLRRHPERYLTSLREPIRITILTPISSQLQSFPATHSTQFHSGTSTPPTALYPPSF